MTHVLLTNDFPPKAGGIQSYLWELWRRLPPGEAVVVTAQSDAMERTQAFDREQPFPVIRTNEKVLLPTPALVRRVREIAADAGADLVLIDPALPLGLIGPRLGIPYGVVLHGAEVTVPGRLPGPNLLLHQVLSRAAMAISAGGYPAREARRVAARRMPPTTVIPPGVDVKRFHPLTADERAATRARYGVAEDAELVVGVSRLVPRKGFDVLIQAAAKLAPSRPDLMVAIGGKGRDAARLDRIAATSAAPVRMLGFVPDSDLPSLNGAADVWGMLCRNRWAGLEQEGFGIVFLEAAACGVAQIAGASGGADEAVVDDETGRVVRRPTDVDEAAATLAGLLDDKDRLVAMGAAARRRVEAEFDYDVLAGRLRDAIAQVQG
ncbi:MAG TPA: glycosyltransferase family 4 protein [Acidimicrobiales bacterium]|nr:glycosyltransferase family 4 protein [Acidimicrobiales bacterium]